ncbi:MAG: hypothetical protein AAGB10_21815 [Pseudomonadota bacterium]
MRMILRPLFAILALGLLNPAPAEEAPRTDGLCLLATKKYSSGAVIVDDGDALHCQADGTWQLAAQVVHCLAQGKSYSSGGRITSPGPEGPIVQVCRKGQWWDQSLAPTKEALLLK